MVDTKTKWQFKRFILQKKDRSRLRAVQRVKTRRDLGEGFQETGSAEPKGSPIRKNAEKVTNDKRQPSSNSTTVSHVTE